MNSMDKVGFIMIGFQAIGVLVLTFTEAIGFGLFLVNAPIVFFIAYFGPKIVSEWGEANKEAKAQ